MFDKSICKSHIKLNSKSINVIYQITRKYDSMTMYFYFILQATTIIKRRTPYSMNGTDGTSAQFPGTLVSVRNHRPVGAQHRTASSSSSGAFG